MDLSDNLCWFHLSSLIQLMSARALAGLQGYPLICLAFGSSYQQTEAPWFSLSDRIDQLPYVIVLLQHSKRVIMEVAKSLKA